MDRPQPRDTNPQSAWSVRRGAALCRGSARPFWSTKGPPKRSRAHSRNRCANCQHWVRWRESSTAKMPSFGPQAVSVSASRGASGRGSDSSCRSRTRRQPILGDFQRRDRLFPHAGGKVVDEALQAVAGSEVVQQIPYRDTCARKKRPGCRPARPGRIARQIRAWAFLCLTNEWRREWDSNPRAGYPTRRFRGAPVTTTSVPFRTNVSLSAGAALTEERLHQRAAVRLEHAGRDLDPVIQRRRVEHRLRRMHRAGSWFGRPVDETPDARMHHRASAHPLPSIQRARSSQPAGCATRVLATVRPSGKRWYTWAHDTAQ